MCTCSENYTFKEMITIFQTCVEKLEEEIVAEINSMSDENYVEHTKYNLDIEEENNLHYTQIVQYFHEIKFILQKILSHTSIIYKNSRSRVKDSYVKKQIQAFDKVEKRVHHPDRERRFNASEKSMQYLDVWKRYLDDQSVKQKYSSMMANVKKRNTQSSIRKKKKFVSSTNNRLLDDDYVEENLPSPVVEETDHSSDQNNNSTIFNYKTENISLPESSKNNDETNAKGFISSASAAKIKETENTSEEDTRNETLENSENTEDAVEMENILFVTSLLRSDSIRKSIYDNLKEDNERTSVEEIPEDQEPPTLTEQEEREIIKPRVVDVIYKSKENLND